MNNLLALTMMYFPYYIAITLNIVVLVYAILIHQSKSSNYGITLMISSIIAIAADVLYIAIGGADLAYRLYVVEGLPIGIVSMILMTWSFVFLGINSTSMILLVVAVNQIYQAHRQA